MPQYVELRNLQRELTEFRRRVGLAAGFVVLMFLVLFARFVWLQIVEHDYYHTQAEDNRISIVPVVPNRGLIVDRHGAVLAENYTAYTLEIDPTRVPDIEATIDALSELVGIAPKDRRRFQRMLDESRRLATVPIRTRLSDEEIARFAANRWRFPGVEINARPFRRYPNGALAAHVVGYIGRINQRDVERLERDGLTANYRGSEHIGKTGLEQFYERELHGITGVEKVEVDSSGRAVRSLARTPATPGNNLRLALDLRLQQAAEAAFGNRRGALVAIEPSTGGVLAFVSMPTFDPNLFIDGIDTQTWNELNNHPDKPMVNRALHGQYPPGSTHKPFLALAALESGHRTPQFAINDPGVFYLPGSTHQFRDWKVGGHGIVDMHRSITISCDIYYYRLGFEMGIDLIAKWMSKFGFGRRTGIDLAGEAVGINPSPEWKQRRFRQPWFLGDTISVSIGQGYSLATLLQLAHATAALANRGIAFRPHLVRHIQDARDGALRPTLAEPVKDLRFRPENWDVIHRAMVDTVISGTAARSGAGAQYSFGGKTGTSQVIGIAQGARFDASRVDERHHNHAMFIAYAPAENPRIALAVLVENGGSGSAAAAPIARALFDFFLTGRPVHGVAPVDLGVQGD
jgi:penicillin-binding protein 2